MKRPSLIFVTISTANTKGPQLLLTEKEGSRSERWRNIHQNITLVVTPTIRTDEMVRNPPSENLLFLSFSALAIIITEIRSAKRAVVLYNNFYLGNKIIPLRLLYEALYEDPQIYTTPYSIIY